MDGKLADLLVRMAEQLGFQAARVWPQMVMITWINAVFWLAASVLLPIMALVVASRITPWALRKVERGKAEEGHYDAEGCYILIGISWGVAVGLLAAAILDFPGNLSSVLYPEAATVLRLMGGK